jgi:hypothetical protein
MSKSQVTYTDNLCQICVRLTYNVFVLAPQLYSANAVQQTPQSTILLQKLPVKRGILHLSLIKP